MTSIRIETYEETLSGLKDSTNYKVIIPNTFNITPAPKAVARRMPRMGQARIPVFLIMTFISRKEVFRPFANPFFQVLAVINCYFLQLFSFLLLLFAPVVASEK